MNALARILKAIVNIMLGIVGVLLGLRFILKFFSANPNNEFVDWVYRSSGEILGPFRGIFPVQTVQGVTIEFSTIFALLVYGLIGLLVFYVIDLLDTPRTTVVEKRKR